ncbi:hypothetical protein RB213_000330 [Colletotrichum asianum]
MLSGKSLAPIAASKKLGCLPTSLFESTQCMQLANGRADNYQLVLS